MPGKCDAYHPGQLFIVDACHVGVGARYEINNGKLEEVSKRRGAT